MEMHHNTPSDTQFILKPQSYINETAAFSPSSLICSISSSFARTLCLEKRTDEKGYRSMHVTRPLSAGSVIAYFIGEEMPASTRHTVQMDDNTHIHSEDGPAYINHSCVPTAYITGDPAEKRSIIVVALRDLKEGDEVTCNFNATEVISSAPFKCHCNYEKCVETVRGFDHLSDEQRAHLLATTRLSPYVEMVYKSRQMNEKQVEDSTIQNDQVPHSNQV